MHIYRANGKLLLTAEYFVLDGALALALPTRYGQCMELYPSSEASILHCFSLNDKGNIWFEKRFDQNNLNAFSEDSVTRNFGQIIQLAQQLNPQFHPFGNRLVQRLEFPRNWGLGSSSTLLYNIAQWASVNPYILSDRTFGGSAYDIACAMHDTPILYRRLGDTQEVENVSFNPLFSDQLFFVHLNRKENSRQAIAYYKAKKVKNLQVSSMLEEITRNILDVNKIDEFENLLLAHEKIISKALDMPTIQQIFFSDYEGIVKSLGAWGGDFVLVTFRPYMHEYFERKGFKTIIPYKEMILHA